MKIKQNKSLRERYTLTYEKKNKTNSSYKNNKSNKNEKNGRKKMQNEK